MKINGSKKLFNGEALMKVNINMTSINKETKMTKQIKELYFSLQGNLVLVTYRAGKKIVIERKGSKHYITKNHTFFKNLRFICRVRGV